MTAGYRVQCPTCQRRVVFDRVEDARFRPFCSKRCQLIDLDNWFREQYRIGRVIDETGGADESAGPYGGQVDPDEAS